MFIGVALWRVWIEGDPEEGGGTKKKADVVCSVNVNMSAEDGNGPMERQRVEEWWLRAVGSMRISDYNLFGNAE